MRRAGGRRRVSNPRKSRAPRRRGRVAGKRRGMRRVNNRKSVPKRQLIQANLGGISTTRFVSSRRPNAVVSTIKKSGAPNYINVSYPWHMKSELGQQGVSCAFIASRGDLLKIWASIQGQQTYRNADNIWYAGEPTTKTITNPGFRYALESVNQLLYFANTGATPINVELYDIAVKRNGPLSIYDVSGNNTPGASSDFNPLIAWAQSVDGSLGQASEALNATGFKDALFYNSTDVEYQNLGATPYNSKLFQRYFKVVRKTNLSLPIGGQHKHIVDLKSNYLVDNFELGQSSALAGLTMFTMIVASGVPVVACPPVGSANPDVSVSATSLSVVQTLKYKYAWTQDTSPSTYVASYVQQVNTGMTSVQPAMVKVYDAGNSTATYIDNSAPQYVNLPSECTR